METWGKATAQLARIFGYIGGGAVAVMTLNVLLNAALRAAFSWPIPATLELVQYWWMIALGLGGWALAAWTGEHIDAPIIGDRISPRWKVVWRIIAHTVGVFYLSLIFWYGLEVAIHAFEIGEYQGGYNTPIWPVRFFVPIATAAFMLVLLFRLVEAVLELKNFPRGESGIPRKPKTEKPAAEAAAQA